MTAEVLPRPAPYVDAHALDRFDQRIAGGLNRATISAIVQDGPELREPHDAPWVGTLKLGNRYFLDRRENPTLVVVLREESWAVVTVLTRAFGERRQRQPS